jgi:dihydroorotate dehydrogenase (NAD+) catalytic subunit
MAKAVVESGADSISLVNTFLGMAIDAEAQKPILSTRTGGLSGPAIKPIALRMVWDVYHAVDVPVIGMGGIMNATDAIEFILAGSTAIQVGTANFIDPAVSVKVVEGIEEYMDRHGVKSINELIGALKS